ncbi:unnamed protein product [Boreogadus saida]
MTACLKEGFVTVRVELLSLALGSGLHHGALLHPSLTSNTGPSTDSMRWEDPVKVQHVKAGVSRKCIIEEFHRSKLSCNRSMEAAIMEPERK